MSLDVSVLTPEVVALMTPEEKEEAQSYLEWRLGAIGRLPCEFLPRQVDAEEASERFKYVLYGGARGPGKSFFLRWAGIRFLLMLAKRGIPRAHGALFCEDYPSLKDRHIGKIKVEVPDWLGELKDTKEDGLGFYIREDHGGGILKLRNLDDPSKYQSSEFAWIGVDELTKNLLDTFHILRGSLRWPGLDDPRFVGATNPGSIGHLWVKAFWIDGEFPREMEGIAHQFAFVKALPKDNPYLSQDYWDTLNSLPPDLARAWRDGDWDVFEGQMFGELSRDVHGFEGDPPPGKIICWMDYGEVAPTAFYWAVVDSRGDLWVYRELYETGLQYVALKQELRRRSVDREGKPERIAYTVVSPDIFMTSKGTGVVGSEVFNSNTAEHGGFSWPVVRGDNNRIEGWRHMKQWIHSRRFHVHLGCRHFWRTVPAMVYDEKDPEDMDDRGEDHCAEAARYGLMSRPKPEGVKGEKIGLFTPKHIEKLMSGSGGGVWSGRSV